MVTILEKWIAAKSPAPRHRPKSSPSWSVAQDSTGIRRKLQGLTNANKAGALDALRCGSLLICRPCEDDRGRALTKSARRPQSRTL
jgi:hypothetical protein